MNDSASPEPPQDVTVYDTQGNNVGTVAEIYGDDHPFAP
jgi:hypothetical protein